MTSTPGDLKRWTSPSPPASCSQRLPPARPPSATSPRRAEHIADGLGLKLGDWVGHNGEIDGFTLMSTSGATPRIVIRPTSRQLLRRRSKCSSRSLEATLSGRRWPRSAAARARRRSHPGLLLLQGGVARVRVGRVGPNENVAHHLLLAARWTSPRGSTERVEDRAGPGSAGRIGRARSRSASSSFRTAGQDGGRCRASSREWRIRSRRSG